MNNSDFNNNSNGPQPPAPKSPEMPRCAEVPDVPDEEEKNSSHTPEKKAAIKSVGRKMSLTMGVIMSLVLSLAGHLSSGHFLFSSFMLSFFVSAGISIVIGFLVPMGKINAAIERKLLAGPKDILVRLTESLVADLIYTPIITLAMVILAYNMVMTGNSQAPNIPFFPMFARSFLICFTIGYILIFFLTPLLQNLFMKSVDKEFN